MMTSGHTLGSPYAGMAEGGYAGLMSEFAALETEHVQAMSVCRSLQRENQSLRDNYEEVGPASVVTSLLPT